MIGAETAAEAAEAIRSVGTTATLRRDTATDPTTYPPTAGTTTTYTLDVVLASYSTRDRDGTLIRASDVKVMVAADGETPHEGDRLEIGGRTYSIVSVTTVQPSGVAIYHVAQARGA